MCSTMFFSYIFKASFSLHIFSVPHIYSTATAQNRKQTTTSVKVARKRYLPHEYEIVQQNWQYLTDICSMTLN